mmetsp:Transcript_36173/g.116844  ORF Transcript_36173/g.116844 Transcript_36173/m.116844 type:complete len:230 (-) Transcript_36173:1678-2367(-)
MRHPKCAGSPPRGWRQAVWRWPHAPAPSSLHRLNPSPVLHRVGRRRRTRCRVGRRRARRRLLRDGVRWREGRRCSLPGGALLCGRLSRALPKRLPGRRLSRSLHGGLSGGRLPRGRLPRRCSARWRRRSLRPPRGEGGRPHAIRVWRTAAACIGGLGRLNLHARRLWRRGQRVQPDLEPLDLLCVQPGALADVDSGREHAPPLLHLLAARLLRQRRQREGGLHLALRLG